MQRRPTNNKSAALISAPALSSAATIEVFSVSTAFMSSVIPSSYLNDVYAVLYVVDSGAKAFHIASSRFLLPPPPWYQVDEYWRQRDAE
jgi:hypothetical protein